MKQAFVLSLLFCLLLCGFHSFGQRAIIQGRILDENNLPLVMATIFIKGSDTGTLTDTDGKFRLEVLAEKDLVCIIQYNGYISENKQVHLSSGQVYTLNISLKIDTKLLEVVEIKGKEPERDKVSLIQLDSKDIEDVVSPFNDISAVLKTLIGVQTNSELSSSYAVRGGNFDENLIYVNGIKIYRPFLLRAGRQEGLSFVNPNLVDNLSFYAGAWPARYGDKLSSVLDVTYKKPEAFGASVSLGILNSMAHLEGISKNKKFQYTVGIRRKSAQYLLNTLDVDGEYLPQFIDGQGFFNFHWSNKTQIALLTSYARNRYKVLPTARETTFGLSNNFVGNKTLRLFVAFDGQEKLNYDIFQNALKLTHQWNKKFKTHLIASSLQSFEREYTSLEGGYRLCEVNTNPNSSNFNECATEIGIGTQYEYLRNQLDARVYALETQSVFDINDQHQIEWGARYTREIIEDRLDEYEFTDSSDFVTIDRILNTSALLNSHRYSAYLQHNMWLGKQDQHQISYGLRWGYWNINQEMLWSPSLQYSFRPDWERDIILKASVGIYQQAPFYRELRNFEGDLNLNVKAQKSIQAIVGADYSFKIWGRDFRLLTEAYYKNLTDVIPYDIDNIRIRYYAHNDAKAFAYGLDARISGEFIKGAESWFSFGVLNTKEDVLNDEQGYIRRPTDQRFTFAAYFEDHIPGRPLWRVSISAFYGTGYPFGVPNFPEYRTVFRGPNYGRVDIGFSKIILFKNHKKIKSIWIGADILNLMASKNTISHTWIKDINGTQYAVPNNLSTRFLNIRVITKF